MEEINAMRPEVETQPIVSETSILLTRFIETHADPLMGILRSYVSTRGIASNDEEVQEAAIELLHEVYIEATKTSTHFDSTRSPQAWLLGIAINILKQKKREIQQRRQHEIALSDFQQHSQVSSAPDGDPLERLSILYGKGLEEETEMREEVRYLLSLVSEKDRYILELSYMQGLDGDALALELDCSYTAAQVRLCRARQRLRAVLARQKGESHE